MKLRVPGQEVDQRKLGQRLWKKTVRHKLNREDAMEGNRWRKQIRDEVEGARCEWLNVSSDTGSPGLSNTKS